MEGDEWISDFIASRGKIEDKSFDAMLGMQ